MNQLQSSTKITIIPIKKINSIPVQGSNITEIKIGKLKFEAFQTQQIDLQKEKEIEKEKGKEQEFSCKLLEECRKAQERQQKRIPIIIDNLE